MVAGFEISDTSHIVLLDCPSAQFGIWRTFLRELGFYTHTDSPTLKNQFPNEAEKKIIGGVRKKEKGRTRTNLQSNLEPNQTGLGLEIRRIK